MDTHAREISLTKQTRASYDAYLDALPNSSLPPRSLRATLVRLRGQMDARPVCRVHVRRQPFPRSQRHRRPSTCRLRNLTYSILPEEKLDAELRGQIADAELHDLAALSSGDANADKGGDKPASKPSSGAAAMQTFIIFSSRLIGASSA